MSTEHDGRAYKNELDVALREMLMYQVEVAEERAQSGAVSEETHADFERAVMSMRRRLLPYAADVEDFWRQANIDAIPELCANVVHEEQGVGHLGVDRGKKSRVEHAHIEHLEAWSDALVEIYSRLGFTPEAEIGQIEARGDYSDVLD